MEEMKSLLITLQDPMKVRMICSKFVDLYVKLDPSYMEALVRSVEILKEIKLTSSNEDH